MTFNEKIALIIGIDVYYHQTSDNSPSLLPLRSCKKDALDMYDLLCKLGYTVFEKKPIIGSELEDTKFGWTEIRRAITDFFSYSKPNQILLFYFSGHGITHGKGNLTNVYLSTPQIDPRNPNFAGISFSELTNWISTDTHVNQNKLYA